MYTRAVPRTIAWMFCVAMAALLPAACEHSPTDRGVVATITVTRNPDTLAVGTARQFTATGRDANGDIVGIDPVWSVAAGGGTISDAGVFTAGTVPGTFASTVVATVGSISGRATVTVIPGAAASIVVSPPTVTLAPGGTQQFTAVVRDAAGNVITTAPNWSVAAGGGTISPTGLFTAGATPGTYTGTVAATIGAISGRATVIVTAGPAASLVVTPDPAVLGAGDTQQFTATVRDAAGNVLPAAAVWSVVGGGGTISPTGLFTAGTVSGTFPRTVVATLGSVADSATVTVTAGTLASITVTPNPVTMGAGDTQQFTATGRDAFGNTVAFTPLWDVRAGGGTIDNSGRFTAGPAAGTYPNTVRACSTGACAAGSISGTATVTVIPGTLATVTVTPNPVTLSAGDVRQFTATGRDANGNVVAFTPVWSVQSGGGSIDADGTFTAGNVAGTFPNTVRACSTAACGPGSVSGSATVTVIPGTLATVVVTPNPVTLDGGETQQFTATGRDANGNLIAFTPVWSVQSGGGTIDADGTFTAGTIPGTYPNTVRACSTAACGAGSVSGSATVTVLPGTLATVTVTPNPATLDPGETQQFTATGRDINGNVIAFTPTWSVQSGGGTISASGLFTAGNVPGTFPNTVRACSTAACGAGSVSGSATVTVTALPVVLTTITVTPNPVTLDAGETQQFTATGRDANNNVVPTPGLVWSVQSGGGTINPATGLFTAGNVAGTFPNTVRATSGTVSGTATVTVTAPPPPPFLGRAATHGILAGTMVSCASAPGIINADVSVWPGVAITGFPPCTLTGQRHAGDTYAQNAQTDLTIAYNALDAMPCTATITTNMGGTTLAPGVYCAATSVGVTGTVTLSGPASAVFVIKAGTSLTTAGSVVMAGGAQAKNVYWLVGSSATLGTGSAWQGNIIAFTSITLVDNVTILGRALARNGAVTLGTGSVITLP
ncbi:ice-binding family protein [Longimicrobium terrae]|uniref:DUF3494 domain-containing protein n=1 Tax=Longimicrobium terrae TaxID=1639882 RepID=A0A841GVY2_9BACT|nr:ice-binding family protein [Longimicrobium terrae]MBB4634730.1 hypothetical protein [Longimicrobium terrae]MBB6069125.1 hypothetical protein [Longimicrobium terrae]NNC32058.1 DUF3494 domain-containing protein [Longimicrobium terrae]